MLAPQAEQSIHIRPPGGGRSTAGRIRNFLVMRDATVPEAALPPMTGKDKAKCLLALAGEVEPLADGTVRMHRADLPEPVILDPQTWEWHSADEAAAGTGMLELAIWLTGQDIWGVVALLRLIYVPEPAGLWGV